LKNKPITTTNAPNLGLLKIGGSKSPWQLPEDAFSNRFVDC
jgi:hypothetical protein